MPRPRRTEEEIEEMRQRILDAAVEVLHDEGAVLGVSPPGQSEDEPFHPVIVDPENWTIC